MPEVSCSRKAGLMNPFPPPRKSKGVNSENRGKIPKGQYYLLLRVPPKFISTLKIQHILDNNYVDGFSHLIMVQEKELFYTTTTY